MGGIELPAGTVLDGRWRVLSVLGRGGFSITYLAADAAGGGSAAVKEFFPAGLLWRDADVSAQARPLSPGAAPWPELERFLDEAKALALLDGVEGVAHLLASFRENGTAYVVTEYVPGRTLRQRLAGGTMDAAEAAGFFAAAAAALAAPHARGVLQLDLRPENIIVRPDGSPCLIDFGAARPAGEAGANALGNYAPPESFGGGEATERSDVYALCATLYEAAAGAPPESAAMRIFLDQLAPAEALRPGLDARLAAAIARGLELEPVRRWPDMASLAAALRAVHARRRSRRAVLWAAAAAALALAGSLALWRGAAVSDPFYGVEDYTVYLVRDYRVNDGEWAAQLETLRAGAEALAGDGPSSVEDLGGRARLRLAREALPEGAAASAAAQALSAALAGQPGTLLCELEADWQDPDTCAWPGENQTGSEAFDGGSWTLLFSVRDGGQLASSELAAFESAAKARLDALGAPYAFGLAAGDAQGFAVRLPREDWCLQAAQYLFVDSLQLRDGAGSGYVSLYGHDISSGGASIAVLEDGQRLELRFTDEEDVEALSELSRAGLDAGEPRLYLAEAYRERGIMEAELTGPVTDGRLSLSLSPGAFSPPDGEARAALTEYVSGLLSTLPALPSSAVCTLSAIELRGEGGEIEAEYADGLLPDALLPEAGASSGPDWLSEYLGGKYGIDALVERGTVFIMPLFDTEEGELLDFLAFTQQLAREVQLCYEGYSTAVYANWNIWEGVSISDVSLCAVYFVEKPQGGFSAVLSCGEELESMLPALREAWSTAGFGEGVDVVPEIVTG